MRTRSDIDNTARLIAERGRELPAIPTGAESRLASGSGERLYVFPETSANIGSRAFGLEPFVLRTSRYVDGLRTDNGTVFRLIEEEFVCDTEDHLLRQVGPTDLLTSCDPWDIAKTGYSRIDEDQVRSRVEPLLARVAEGARGQDALELEILAEELGLSLAAKMRMKADAIDVIEGRLELGDFIARTVARQECYQEARSVRQLPAYRQFIEV